MGLDMYLSEKIYIGGNYEHNSVAGAVKLTIAGEEIDIPTNRLSEVTLTAGYWRKANQIHNWFVENVQDNVDNCSSYYVSYDMLKELKTLCLKVLADKSKAKEILPASDGFFFGDSDYNEWYFEGLENTVEIIDTLNPESEYEYHSSW